MNGNIENVEMKLLTLIRWQQYWRKMVRIPARSYTMTIVKKTEKSITGHESAGGIQ